MSCDYKVSNLGNLLIIPSGETIIIGKNITTKVHITGDFDVDGITPFATKIALEDGLALKIDKAKSPFYRLRDENTPIEVTSGLTQNIETISEIDDSCAHVVHFNSQYITRPEFVTRRVKDDLFELYNMLIVLPITQQLATPLNNITLSAGVYWVSGAGVASVLTLNGSSTDVFVFRFDGAFSTNASTRVTLQGGVVSANIFWITTSGAALALAHTGEHVFPGTCIAAAAASMGSGGKLNGRLLSMAGAVALTNSNISIPTDVSTYQTEINSVSAFAVFATAGAVSNTSATTFVYGDIGTNAGAVTGFPDLPNASIFISTDKISKYNLYIESNGIRYSKRCIDVLTDERKGGIISLHTIIPPSSSEVTIVVESYRGSITFEDRTFSVVNIY